MKNSSNIILNYNNIKLFKRAKNNIYRYIKKIMRKIEYVVRLQLHIVQLQRLSKDRTVGTTRTVQRSNKLITSVDW